MKKFTISNRATQDDDYIASVHKVGCKAIEKENRVHSGSSIVVEGNSAKEVAQQYIDECNSDFGYKAYSINNIKVHNCCK